MQYLVKNVITNEVSYQEIDVEFINALLEKGETYPEEGQIYIKPTEKEKLAFIENQNKEKSILELDNLKKEKLTELEDIYNKSQICLVEDGLDAEGKRIILPVILRDSGHLIPMASQYDQAEREGASFFKLNATNGKQYISMLTIEEWRKLYYPAFRNVSSYNYNIKEIYQKSILGCQNKIEIDNINFSLLNTNYSIKLSDFITRNDGNILLENTVENFNFLLNQ